ncbi:MAG: hypothetical protein HKN13_00400, partial [Rhodothermales bacterium]|nr:hypothetical protein [Rhodothermales bacterium]
MTVASEVESIRSEYPEVIIGVSVRDATDGFSLDINADHEFHAASTMKVPVMIELFRQVQS